MHSAITFSTTQSLACGGVEDYKKQIARLSCYLTPEFRGVLERDYENKAKRHELSRTRALQEMPERPLHR